MEATQEEAEAAAEAIRETSWVMAKGRIPPDERMEKGPVVVVECEEEIPCNPCVKACPVGAITIEGNINNLPVVDFDLCTGCGLCIAGCPGLAIFVVHKNYRPDRGEGLVMLPYEFIPLPKKGDKVWGLDRNGKVICEATVERVLNTPKQDRTAIISVAVPSDLVMEVRNIKLK